MIKTTLPVIERTYDEEKEKIVTVKKDIPVTINTSVFAEMRWEQQFPHNAEKETLQAYVARLLKEKKERDVAWIVSALKAIYCLIEGEDIQTFKAFCSLFDMADSDHLANLADKIRKVFNIAITGSAVSAKN